MFTKGQKVRVKANVAVASEGIGGHVATVQSDEREHDGLYYRVLFDDPADEGWIHWLDDTWLNDYEIEAADVS